MLLPPPTDLFALIGIDLVLCAVGLRVLGAKRSARPWAKVLLVICFLLFWIPAGEARLPLLAYTRGITSDFSVTTVLLAIFSLSRSAFGVPAMALRENLTLNVFVASAAVFLYPLALGLGDWDAYRLGWNAAPLWAGLFCICVVCRFKGLRLLPLLVACALLGWVAGLLESTNLWDYLLDPWLSATALIAVLRYAYTAARVFVVGNLKKSRSPTTPVELKQKLHITNKKLVKAIAAPSTE